MRSDNDSSRVTVGDILVGLGVISFFSCGHRLRCIPLRPFAQRRTDGTVAAGVIAGGAENILVSNHVLGGRRNMSLSEDE